MVVSLEALRHRHKEVLTDDFALRVRNKSKKLPPDVKLVDLTFYYGRGHKEPVPKELKSWNNFVLRLPEDERVQLTTLINAVTRAGIPTLEALRVTPDSELRYQRNMADLRIAFLRKAFAAPAKRSR